MFFVKLLILLGIFLLSVYIGIMISNKYVGRVQELKEMKNACNMFETKMKFTYEPVPSIFEEIAKKIPNSRVGEIFAIASRNMKQKSAGEAWQEAIDCVETNLTPEDKEIVKNLRKATWKNRCSRTD